jgi:hypothetical protein
VSVFGYFLPNLRLMASSLRCWLQVQFWVPTYADSLRIKDLHGLSLQNRNGREQLPILLVFCWILGLSKLTILRCAARFAELIPSLGIHV